MPDALPPFNIVIVAQAGRLQFEALLFVASLRMNSPAFQGRMLIAQPSAGKRWSENPEITDPNLLGALHELGAEIIPFRNNHFGETYPHGNKIEMLRSLPKGEPFVFFDTDTLITSDITRVPFDFSKPSASLRREGTWPKAPLYGPDMHEIWQSLYAKFDLDFVSSQDTQFARNDWRRYLYFNAGYFFYKCPHRFGRRFLDHAVQIKRDAPAELACQELDPWLDQVALPLTIHSFGGGRDTLPDGYLDAETSCHYRLIPLLYARESDKAVRILETISKDPELKPILRQHPPIRRMVFQKQGQKLRDLFDRENLPQTEREIRSRIKDAGLWIR